MTTVAGTWYRYSIAVMSALLLALTHVPNLVVTLAWLVRRLYGIPILRLLLRPQLNPSLEKMSLGLLKRHEQGVSYYEFP